MELRALGIGSQVAGLYMGAFGFSDDMVFLAPPRDGMQIILDTCHRLALKYRVFIKKCKNCWSLPFGHYGHFIIPFWFANISAP